MKFRDIGHALLTNSAWMRMFWLSNVGETKAATEIKWSVMLIKEGRLKSFKALSWDRNVLHPYVQMVSLHFRIHAVDFVVFNFLCTSFINTFDGYVLFEIVHESAVCHTVK